MNKVSQPLFVSTVMNTQKLLSSPGNTTLPGTSHPPEHIHASM